MNEMSVSFRILIGVFLILHGLVLPIMALVPSDMMENASVGSFWTESWFFGTGVGVKAAIYILSAISALLFIFGGMSFMGLLIPYTAMNKLLFAGAIVSLTLIIVFWLPWYIFGVALNLIILIMAVNSW